MRRCFKPLNSLTYIQDFLFWIITGFLLLYSIFTFNNGELRGYIFIAILLGIILYALLLSKYFTKALTYVFNFLNKIIFKPIYTTLKFLRDKFATFYKKIKEKLLTLKSKSKKIKAKKKENKKTVKLTSLDSNKSIKNKQKVSLKNIFKYKNAKIDKISN